MKRQCDIRWISQLDAHHLIKQYWQNVPSLLEKLLEEDLYRKNQIRCMVASEFVLTDPAYSLIK